MNKNAIVLNNIDIQLFKKDSHDIRNKHDLATNRIRHTRKNNNSVVIKHAPSDEKFYYSDKIDVSKPPQIRVPKFDSFGKYMDRNIISLFGFEKRSSISKNMKLSKFANENSGSRNLVTDAKKPMEIKLYNTKVQTVRNKDFSVDDVKNDTLNPDHKSSKYRIVSRLFLYKMSANVYVL
jgi:predicted NodU family carbamoyl transferase